MKLFDRSVDLAQFPEDSPLYPVCRAWIHNRPYDKSLGTLAERPPSPDSRKTDSDMQIKQVCLGNELKENNLIAECLSSLLLNMFLQS